MTQAQHAFEFYGRADAETQAAAAHRVVAARQLLKQGLNPTLFLDDRLDETRKILARFPATGQWFLQHTDFLVWAEINTPGTQILVLHGIPGAGKTILSYIAFDNLLKQAGYKAHHLRLTGLPNQNNDCLGAMHSLLYELASQDIAEIETILDALDQIQIKRLKREQIIEQNLCRIIVSNGPTFLFIDGLDEFNEDSEIQNFLEVLENLTKQCSNLRILLSCRMEEPIKTIISTWNHFAISTTSSLLRHDISQFVHHSDNMNTLIKDYKFNATEAKAYLDALCLKSDGMFLYAKLILAELKFQSNRKEVNDLINELPEGLDGAYRRSITRISKLRKIPQLRAKFVFQFLLVARRPLREAELRQAVVAEPFIEKFIPTMELRLSLGILCGSLIEVNEDRIVTLVHSSLKRYLLEQDRIIGFHPVAAHWLVGNLCFNYLSLKSVYTKNIVDYRRFVEIGEFAFLGYASENYLEHLKQGIKTQSPGANSEMETLFENMNVILRQLLSHLQETVDEEVESISAPAILFFKRNRDDEIGSRREISSQDLLLSLRKEGNDDFSKVIFAMTSALMVPLNKMLGTIAREQISPITTDDSLFKTYGYLHRCHKHTCKDFWAGFPSSSDLEKHKAKHQRSFKCPQTTCISHGIGFVTEKELKHHMALNHKVDSPRAAEAAEPSIKFASIIEDKATLGQKIETFLSSLKDALISNDIEWAERLSDMYCPTPEAHHLDLAYTPFQGRNRLKRRWKMEVSFSAPPGNFLMQIFEGNLVPQRLSELAAYYGSRSILKTLQLISKCLALEGLNRRLLAMAIAGSNLETLQYIISDEFDNDVGDTFARKDRNFIINISLNEFFEKSLPQNNPLVENYVATFTSEPSTDIPYDLVAALLEEDEIFHFLRGKWTSQPLFQELVSKPSLRPYRYTSPLFISSIMGANNAVQIMAKLPEYNLDRTEAVSLLLLLFGEIDENKRKKLFNICKALRPLGEKFSGIPVGKLFQGAIPIILENIQFHGTKIEDSIKILEGILELDIEPTILVDMRRFICSTDVTKFEPWSKYERSHPPTDKEYYLPEEGVSRALIHLMKLEVDIRGLPTVHRELHLSSGASRIPKNIRIQMLQTCVEDPKLQVFWAEWRPFVVAEFTGTTA
ncbi:hypothetical protein TWF694_005792 [Orbilia ellipsospora]